MDLNHHYHLPGHFCSQSDKITLIINSSARLLMPSICVIVRWTT